MIVKAKVLFQIQRNLSVPKNLLHIGYLMLSEADQEH